MLNDPYPIRIRPAKKSDVAFIQALSGVFDPYGPYEEILPKWFLSGIALTLLAVVNEEPAGYIMLGRNEGRHERPIVVELLAIAVTPTHYHRGVGERLMRAIIRIAEDAGVDIMILHTGVHNLHAQALFKKHGFSPMGVKKKFYEGGQSALMMQKKF